MMIKIERNFFDDDLIEELSTLAIKFYKSNNLRTNFSSWKDGIVQCSSVVLIYDIPQDNKIYKKLSTKFDTEDFNFRKVFFDLDGYFNGRLEIGGGPINSLDNNGLYSLNLRFEKYIENCVIDFIPYVSRGDDLFGDDVSVSYNIDFGNLNADIIPDADNTRALGSSVKRFTTLHSAALNTGDIIMKNDNGHFTIDEQNEYLRVYNHSNGKYYKLLMEEIEN